MRADADLGTLRRPLPLEGWEAVCCCFGMVSKAREGMLYENAGVFCIPPDYCMRIFRGHMT